VKHKTVHADLLIPSDAHSLYQFLLIAYSGESCHEPAVAVIPLSHIVRGRASDIELRFLEYVLRQLAMRRRLGCECFYLDSFDGHGLEVGLLLVQSRKAIGWCVWQCLRSLEVGFDVEVRVAIFLIQTTAFFDNLRDLVATRLDSLFVRCKGIDTRYRALRRMSSGSFRIQIVGQYGKDLAGMFGRELVPEVINASLGRVFTRGYV
jgi:hypothetical protein